MYARMVCYSHFTWQGDPGKKQIWSVKNSLEGPGKACACVWVYSNMAFYIKYKLPVCRRYMTRRGMCPQTV